MKTSAFGTIVLSAFLALPTVVLAAADFTQGTLHLIEGKAHIERAGRQFAAQQSASLQQGDTLVVDPVSRVQVRFADDSVFVVPGPARLRVDEFVLPTPEAGGKAIYTLVDGSVRTVTGKISKGPTDQYEMRAKEATITVAGSAYSALRCAGACAAKYKPGLYVRAESGLITVTNPGGELKLVAGQTAFVLDRTTAPVVVTITPFRDPQIAAGLSADVRFEAEVHPPRIERDPVPSPSQP